MLEHVKSAAPLKLGFLPTHRWGVFDIEAAGREKAKIAQKLRDLKVEFLDIDWLNKQGLMYKATDAEAVADRWRREGVDAVFAAHCNFGEETAVGRVCKLLGKPILLWGTRDEAPGPNGGRDRDTQCGLFATSKLLRRLRLPFTYIINTSVDDPVFSAGLDVFLRAANVARCVRGARIGQISTRPTPFTSTMCNESELLERFDVELIPAQLPTVISDVMPRVDSRETAGEARSIAARVDTSAVDDEHLRRIAALKLTIRDWAVRDRLDAVAIHCWDALAVPLGIVPCFLNGELIDMGIPVACETDVNGAITSLALQAAARSESAIFFADLTIRHPQDDNAELLWHCGPFPTSLARPDTKPVLSAHYMRKGLEPGVGNFELRGGPVTLGRFDGDNGEYRFLMGHVEGCDGPPTRGTYLWVRARNWPLWEEKLIYGPYIHHVVGVHGKLAPALYEGVKYLGVEPECIDPTEDEIRAGLRGQAPL